MPSEKVLPATISYSEQQDRNESIQLRATQRSLCIFGYQVTMNVATLIVVLMVGIIAPLSVLAQPLSEHSSHHPDNNGASTTKSTTTEINASVVPSIQATTVNSKIPLSKPDSSTQYKNGASANMMSPSSATPGPSGCCGMMATGGKPFYPSLMDFPQLTDETRKYIRKEAIARLGLGVQLITSIQTELHHALSMNDVVAAQNALGKVRQGLSFAESGASALQALNEAQPAPQIALTWFKREMSLGDTTDKVMDGSFRNVSWLHITLMLLLAAAFIIALLVRWARLRRIKALIQRLTPGNDAAKPISNGPKTPESVNSFQKTEPPIQQRWSGILRTMAIFEETPNVKTFRLMEPNFGAIPFTFLPGQYATITSVIHGEKVRRSYTISSSPTQSDYIELTVKREQYGLESRHLHDHINTGDLLEVSAPAGAFFFTGKEANGIVLIAGGVGITPMMSVLRYLTDRSYPKDVHLLYAVNSPANIIFQEEFAYLSRRHQNISVVIIVSSTDGAPWSSHVGLITADFIVKAVPDIAQHRIHLCGPVPMMDAVKAALLQLKIPLEQIKTEHFAPPKGGPVGITEPPNASSASKPSVVSSNITPVTPPSAHSTVTFSISNKSGQLAPDQSVLEAAEAVGVFIDSECRVGTCGRCKVALLEGTVTMEVDDALSEEEKAKGIILACQAKSASSLVVES